MTIQCVATGAITHHDAVLHELARLGQIDNHLHIANSSSVGWLEINTACQSKVVASYDARLVYCERGVITCVI